jgi:hypothetical protein
MLRIKQYYADKENLDKESKARLLASDLAYLQARASLETDKLKKIELQSQIIDKQHEYTAALTEAAPQIMLTREGIGKLNDQLFKESELLSYAAKKQKDGSEALAELEGKAQNQANTILEISGSLSQSIYELASGGENALREAGKNILLFALDMLKTQTEIAIAGATIQSLAQPDSVATFGVTGLIRAAILVGLIEAAFAGVKGLVNNAFTPKSKSSGYSSGGYTGPGDKLEIAGPVHRDEYVIPSEGLKNPYVRQVIDIIDLARKDGNLATINLRTINQAVSATNYGYTSGGYSSAIPSNRKINLNQDVQQTADPELKKLLAENALAIKELMKWDPSVSIEMLERKRKLYDKIVNGGLK